MFSANEIANWRGRQQNGQQMLEVEGEASNRGFTKAHHTPEAPIKDDIVPQQEALPSNL